MLLHIKSWMPQLNLFMTFAHFVQSFASVVVCNVMELIYLLRVPCKKKAAVGNSNVMQREVTPERPDHITRGLM